jgi:hypothetical protein
LERERENVYAESFFYHWHCAKECWEKTSYNVVVNAERSWRWMEYSGIGPDGVDRLADGYIPPGTV